MAVRLLAWIDDEGGVDWIAGFVSSDAVGRQAAMRTFHSREAAEQWVKDEAHLLDVEVEWIEGG
jgi:hypothetical protein